MSGIGRRFDDLHAVMRHPMGRRAFLSLLGLAGLAACVGDESSSPPAGFLERTVEFPRPGFDPSTYRLEVNGLVQTPLSFAYSEVLSLPSVSVTCDFRCVEGWGVEDVPWEGVQLRTLMAMARPTAEARFVTFHCLGDVYRESLSLEQAELPIALLAHRVHSHALPPERGSPLRLVFPRMLGYKGAKWVTQVEFRTERDIGYWEQLGYPADAWTEDEQPCGTDSSLLHLSQDRRPGAATAPSAATLAVAVGGITNLIAESFRPLRVPRELVAPEAHNFG